jgi:hypothetical protein
MPTLSPADREAFGSLLLLRFAALPHPPAPVSRALAAFRRAHAALAAATNRVHGAWDASLPECDASLPERDAGPGTRDTCLLAWDRALARLRAAACAAWWHIPGFVEVTFSPPSPG